MVQRENNKPFVFGCGGRAVAACRGGDIKALKADEKLFPSASIFYLTDQSQSEPENVFRDKLFFIFTSPVF